MQHTFSHSLIHHHCKGFTLIELLVAIAMISLLLTMAYPHYTNIAQKVRRSDAQESLFFYQTKLSRCYLQTLDYEACLTAEGLENGKIMASRENYYHLTATLEDHNVILAAVASADSAQDQDSACQRFTLNQYSEMQAFALSGEDNTQVCWGL